MKHTSFPKNTKRMREACFKAKRRGDAALEWFKTNTLTKETKAEFDKLMKSIN